MRQTVPRMDELPSSMVAAAGITRCGTTMEPRRLVFKMVTNTSRKRHSPKTMILIAVTGEAPSPRIGVTARRLAPESDPMADDPHSRLGSLSYAANEQL